MEHIEDNATVMFDPPGQYLAYVGPSTCVKCLRPFGEPGRASAMIKVMTSNGEKLWCQECYEDGVEMGICGKVKQLSKKERREPKK